MSSFIKHLPCKACGSKDNLGEYTDHFWCFGCGFYEEKQDMEALRERLAGTSFKPLQWGDVRESLTFTKHIPKQAMRWLLCYRITSKGKKPLTIYGESDTIILVEDVLSAIKIARLSPEYCAMPLLGSSLSTEHEEVLRDIFKTIYVWLDRDKANQGIKMSRNLRQKGMNTKSIITDLDPKEYTEGEIKTWLKNKL